MESKIVIGKEKKKATTSSTNKTVVKEVGENDLVTMGTKILNEKDEEEDFSLKDLNEKELDKFCHAITRWQIRTSCELAETILGKNARYEDKKKLTTQILEEKVNYIEKLL